MIEDKEDGSITASRNDYAQSKCHFASGNNSVAYPLQELYFIVLLFQENKSFGASYHLHSSSDVREAVSGTIIFFTAVLVLKKYTADEGRHIYE
jgi:hypothetical protein